MNAWMDKNRFELVYSDGSRRTVLTDLTAVQIMNAEPEVASVIVGTGDDMLRIDRNQINFEGDKS